MPELDTVVIGLGIMGSCTLWRLAARGVRAAGFDCYDPPHSLGSSHGLSRIVRRIQFEGDRYVPLARSAYELWSQLERESGRHLFTRTGMLVVGPPGSQLIRGGRESAERAGLPYSVLDAAALRDRYPQHLVADTDVALFDPDAGYISPEDAITAALACAQALGADVHRDTPVLSLKAVAGGVEVMTAGATHRARHAVVAAGTWLGTLLPGFASAIRLERQSFAFLAVDDPSLFTPGRFPVWIRENDASVATSIEASHDHKERILAFGFPSHDGRHVKVGFPVTGSPVTGQEVGHEPTAAERALFEGDAVTRIMNGVRPGVGGFRACLYDNSPDFDFIVGPVSGAPQVTVLGGFSGHGFKHAPALGEIAAALASGERPRVDIAGFAPARLSRFAAESGPAGPPKPSISRQT